MKLIFTLVFSLVYILSFGQINRNSSVTNNRTLGVQVTRTLPKIEEHIAAISVAENIESVEEVVQETKIIEDVETTKQAEVIDENLSNTKIVESPLVVSDPLLMVNTEIITVQIAASKQLLSDVYFGKTPQFHFKNEDGYYRYYSASFRSVEEAKRYADLVKKTSKFKEAFVVKIKGGNKVASYFGR